MFKSFVKLETTLVSVTTNKCITKTKHKGGQENKTLIKQYFHTFIYLYIRSYTF